VIIPEVVILCGGQGTRLRSVVKEVSKTLAPVAGRPFLEILLSWFQRAGVERAVLSTGYLASTISDHFGARFGDIELSYAVEPAPLGTGGGARAAARLCAGDVVLICNGDTYLEFDLLAAVGLCVATRESVVVVTPVSDTERYGRIDIVGGSHASFRGRGIVGAGFISGGVYVLPRSLLTEEGRPAPFSLEDFIFDTLRGARTHAVVAAGRFVDIGVPDDYSKSQEMFGGGT
jgi:D-glycero-alpha-D-manno-heptose 1-phosphate guanylyltransferase